MDERTRKAVEMMGHEPMNPLGSCFEACATQITFASKMPDSIRIYHGIAIANAPGEEGNLIGHAWLEFDDPEHGRIAVDMIWGRMFPVEAYRNSLKPSYEVSYSRGEFIELWKAKDYCGPWDQKIADVVLASESKTKVKS